VTAKDELAALPVFAVLGAPGLALGLFLGWHWFFVVIATIVSALILAFGLIALWAITWAIMGD
jgi:divalent metal cation (Fe/Co/Zn/Cd) transporter